MVYYTPYETYNSIHNSLANVVLDENKEKCISLWNFNQIKQLFFCSKALCNSFQTSIRAHKMVKY